MNGLTPKLQGVEDLAVNYLHCSTYTMNTKLKTIYGQPLTYTKTLVDIQAVNLLFTDMNIQTLLLPMI